MNNEENNIIDREELKNRKDIKKLTICIIIIFLICLFGIAWNFYTDRIEKTNKEEKKDIELKYTETTTPTNVKTGDVYLVDVSQVVDNVMPSIVAITSKKLVNSGHYGPGYFNNEQYSTGAGSGIIVSKSDTELMILTNKHVIEDADELSVTFINDKSVDATVKGS